MTEKQLIAEEAAYAEMKVIKPGHNIYKHERI